MFDDIVQNVRAVNDANATVRKAEELFHDLDIVAADACISAGIEVHGDVADVIDYAIKVKLSRCEFTAARKLASQWLTLTGAPHPLAEGLDYVSAHHLPDSPQSADTVFAYLREKIGSKAFVASGAGTINGRAGCMLLFNIDDRLADQLTTQLQEMLEEKFGDQAVMFAVAGRRHVRQLQQDDLAEQLTETLQRLLQGHGQDKDPDADPRLH